MMVCFAVNVGFGFGETVQIPNRQAVIKQTDVVVHRVQFIGLAEMVPVLIFDFFERDIFISEEFAFLFKTILFEFSEG